MPDIRQLFRRRSAGRDGERGFTLVEMLVVITIIGLIMALVGPRVLNYLSEFEGQGGANSNRELVVGARSVLPR